MTSVDRALFFAEELKMAIECRLQWIGNNNTI